MAVLVQEEGKELLHSSPFQTPDYHWQRWEGATAPPGLVGSLEFEGSEKVREEYYPVTELTEENSHF